ncbi:MAG: hypothetical protein CVV27_05585, partial [Candidatus Melainabacteria bacterium HGW-Melainabacteria-1]
LLIMTILATLISVMHDYSYRMSLDAQNAVTAAAEGKRWRQHNQNQQFQQQQLQQRQGVPPDFPIFRGMPDRGPAPPANQE